MSNDKLDALISNIGERSGYFLAGAYFDSLCDALLRTFGVTRCLAKLQKHDGLRWALGWYPHLADFICNVRR